MADHANSTPAPSTDLPAPSPLPSLRTAFSRRNAIFGALALGTGAAAGEIAALARPALLKPFDADLIEFATRTVALVQHQQQVDDQATDAQAEIDRWNFANKPAVPMLPERPSRMVGLDLSTVTHRITQFSVPLDESDALAAACVAYKEARQAHEHAVADRLAASSVPSLTVLSDRMWKDLISAVERLADMEPRTLAGLAAKASVIEALAETDSDIADWWGQNLLRSVADDAMRLHSSSVMA